MSEPMLATGSPFDAIRQVRTDGTEFWSARDLMPVMGYTRWDHFEVPIRRAMKSAENQGHDLSANFPGSRKITSTKPADDFEFSRFAAYLVAMNGDPNKPEVAAAQAYFAIQTRVAETAPAQRELTEDEIVHQALQIQVRKIESLTARAELAEATVERQAPMVAYVEQYVTDADLIRFATVASTNGITEMALRELLVEKKWIYVETATRWSRSKGQKVTTRRYSEYAHKKPYFQRVENHDAPRFRGEVMHTLKVTPEGAEAIGRLTRRNNNVIDLFTDEEGA